MVLHPYTGLEEPVGHSQSALFFQLAGWGASSLIQLAPAGSTYVYWLLSTVAWTFRYENRLQRTYLDRIQSELLPTTYNAFKKICMLRVKSNHLTPC